MSGWDEVGMLFLIGACFGNYFADEDELDGITHVSKGSPLYTGFGACCLTGVTVTSPPIWSLPRPVRTCGLHYTSCYHASHAFDRSQTDYIRAGSSWDRSFRRTSFRVSHTTIHVPKNGRQRVEGGWHSTKGETVPRLVSTLRTSFGQEDACGRSERPTHPWSFQVQAGH